MDLKSMLLGYDTTVCPSQSHFAATHNRQNKN